MQNVIECAGHPRDMGLQQGSACRAAVGEWLLRERLPARRSRLPDLGAYTSGAIRGRAAGREVIRHFTHLSERVDGLARESRVPVDSVMALHLRTAAGEGSRDLLAGPSLAMTLPHDSGTERRSSVMIRSLGVHEGLPSSACSWLVRRSQPEVGFASLEMTLPWLVSAVAGINEEGLSVSFAPGDTELTAGAKGRAASPPILLVQECLQRFSHLSAGLEWCQNRPTWGQGELLIADRSGDCAIVLFSGEEPSVSQPSEGLLVDGSGSREPVTQTPLKGGGSIDSEALSKLARDSGMTLRAPGWVGLHAADGIIEFVTAAGQRSEWALES